MAPFLVPCEASIAQLPSGELEEDVFQIGVAMQIAQVRAALQRRDQRSGVVRVAEHGVAARLAALAQPDAVAFAPFERAVEGLAKQRGIDREDARREIHKRAVLGEIPDDADCANAVIFMISDYARAITGALLDVNGGEFMP